METNLKRERRIVFFGRKPTGLITWRPSYPLYNAEDGKTFGPDTPIDDIPLIDPPREWYSKFHRDNRESYPPKHVHLCDSVVGLMLAKRVEKLFLATFWPLDFVDEGPPPERLPAGTGYWEYNIQEEERERRYMWWNRKVVLFGDDGAVLYGIEASSIESAQNDDAPDPIMGRTRHNRPLQFSKYSPDTPATVKTLINIDNALQSKWKSERPANCPLKCSNKPPSYSNASTNTNLSETTANKNQQTLNVTEGSLLSALDNHQANTIDSPSTNDTEAEDLTAVGNVTAAAKVEARTTSNGKRARNDSDSNANSTTLQAMQGEHVVEPVTKNRKLESNYHEDVRAAIDYNIGSQIQSIISASTEIFHLSNRIMELRHIQALRSGSELFDREEQKCCDEEIGRLLAAVMRRTGCKIQTEYYPTIALGRKAVRDELIGRDWNEWKDQVAKGTAI